MSDNGKSVSRRSFTKIAGALGALAAAGGSVAAVDSLFGEGAPEANATSEEKTVWNCCNVNCGGRCAFQFHVVDGEIAYLESDNTGDNSFGGLQSRACLRGRSIRRWINSPDRLAYPMKRTGARGSGEFEQISWEEAIETIYKNLKGTIDTYGNEAVYINYATGMYSVTGKPFSRLMNLVGGYLNMYGDYSTAQITAAMPYTYGSSCWSASPLIEAENAELLVMFGNSPAETRMGGANTTYDLAKVRAAGTKIINIDYRMNESAAGHSDEWLPIRPGTDASLVSAIAYVLIDEDMIDRDFLDTHCVGYDENTMPAGSPANSSYKDYILGTGYDKVAKTPEWASPITQVPVDKIYSLAREIGTTKPLYVCQGWGVQRHSNGELASRAIVMLPLLTGQLGLSGTNTGVREAMAGAPVADMPAGENPVTTAISCFSWTDAINRGEEMTALADGVKGKDKLDTGIKFLWNYAGNCITNQHGQINKVHEILQDEAKCEFIVVTDTVMTDSAKYADILLPDVMRQEQVNMSTNGYSECYSGVIFGQAAASPKFECRTSYDVCSDLADKFGVLDAFTEGRTQEDWIKYMYEQGRLANANLPSYEEGVAMGIWKEALESYVALADFRNDPVANALDTPSGKIEIYSAALAEIADTWELPEGEVISPLPIFAPGYESYQDVTDEYPLVLTGFHHKGRTHSSFGFIDILKQACVQKMWINPIDAESRGISNGDTVSVYNERGEVRIEAMVTPRIVPGTVAIPQGAWHDADMDGDQVDHGGCINTLTTLHPSPLAKGNAVHNNIAQVAKVEE